MGHGESGEEIRREDQRSQEGESKDMILFYFSLTLFFSSVYIIGLFFLQNHVNEGLLLVWSGLEFYFF